MRKILLVLILLSLTSNAMGMAKTIVWQCQLVQVNDKKNHVLLSVSKPWDGVYDLVARTIIFTNKGANLKTSYQCEELN